MEAMGRQEMAYSKLARAMPNFYKEIDYGGDSYGGSNHRGGNLTHRREMGIGNFSSHAKIFFYHIRYDDWEGGGGGYEGVNDTYDYYENSPYDYYKGYHDSYDDGHQSCGIGEFSIPCLHHNINERKETYHGVRRPSFGNVHNIASCNASKCNIAHFLWLFEGVDSIMNPLKRRGMV
ncbi:hypothetical protein M9H77_16863 [Catharanthus roseus]|uniref:Uncharacterized protein n=1 Tax=Catharanthus roseus TaxID=4058 RepID=A0ACC0B2X9_CATRO|nr:hypothetical protein M9H77_16863 [Catharanthus roseus]